MMQEYKAQLGKLFHLERWGYWPDPSLAGHVWGKRKVICMPAKLRKSRGWWIYELFVYGEDGNGRLSPSARGTPLEIWSKDFCRLAVPLTNS
jgi:hypothetical protein